MVDRFELELQLCDSSIDRCHRHVRDDCRMTLAKSFVLIVHYYSGKLLIKVLRNRMSFDPLTFGAYSLSIIFAFTSCLSYAFCLITSRISASKGALALDRWKDKFAVVGKGVGFSEE